MSERFFGGAVVRGLMTLFVMVVFVIGDGIGWSADEQAADPWSGKVGLEIQRGQKGVCERSDGTLLVSGGGRLDRFQAPAVVAVGPGGDPLWQRLYRLSGETVTTRGVGALEDRCAIIYGGIHEPSNRGGWIPWVAKLDPNGEVIWARRYDRRETLLQKVGDIRQGRGVILAGDSGFNSVWVMRLDPQGRVVWTRNLARSGVRLGVWDVRLTQDDGVVLAGMIDQDLWVARLDSNGEPLWSVRSGTESGFEFGAGLVETPDRGFLVAAATTSASVDAALWILRFDQSGQVLWQGILGQGPNDAPRFVSPDGLGGMWIAATHREPEMEEKTAIPWILHVQPDGVVGVNLRVVEEDLTAVYNDEGPGIAATSDGGVVFVSRFSAIPHKVGVVKVDQVGRGSKGYPAIQCVDSEYRLVDLPVRVSAVETTSFQVATSELPRTSESVPFEWRESWILAAKGRAPDDEGCVTALRPEDPKGQPGLGPEYSGVLLLNRQFEELDLRIEHLIRTRERTPVGSMYVNSFYRELDIERSPLLDRGMEKSTELIEEWLRKRPDSVAARVALADARLTLAWESRGSGFGRWVSRRGSDAKNESLAIAWDTLNDLYDRKPEDPEFWALYLRLSHLTGQSERFIERVFNDAVGIAPDFLGIYTSQAHYLLPQWGGKRGDVQRFAFSVSESDANDFGEELYARIAISLFFGSEKKKIFGEHEFSWPRVRNGLDLMIDRYPHRFNWHQAAALAALAGDRTAAKDYLAGDRDGYGPDVQDIWRNEDRYVQTLTWANRPAGDDWATQGIAQWPDLTVAISREREGDGSRGFLGFLVAPDDRLEPFLVTAMGPESAPSGSLEHTLELFGRRDKVAGWEVLPKGSDVPPVSGIREIPVPVPRGSAPNDRVVFGRLPTGTPSLGVPILKIGQRERGTKTLFVAGCRLGSPECAQEVVPGKLGSHGSDGRFDLIVDESSFEVSRLGSPVLDATGLVIGVVTGRRFQDGLTTGNARFTLECFEIEPPGPEAEQRAHLFHSVNRGSDLVRTAVSQFLQERRWSDLEQLAERVESLRGTDGSWVGNGVLSVFKGRAFGGQYHMGTDGFDEVGAAIADWVSGLEAESSLNTVAQVVHDLHIRPKPPKDMRWTREEYDAVRKAQCDGLKKILDRHILDFPEDVFARVAGVQVAKRCGGMREVKEALGILAERAPDLTPVFADAVRGFEYQSSREGVDFGPFVESIGALAGPEVRETLYGITMIDVVFHKHSEEKPRHWNEGLESVDEKRVAEEYERWIELYPGGSFGKSTLLGLLCAIGETDRAADLLDIRLCTDVHIMGNRWSTEICRECFGGNVIPKSE